MVLRDTTLPRLRMRYSRSWYSSGWRLIRSPPRVTLCETRSISRSSTFSTVGSAWRDARLSSACTRASSSATENGFAR